MIFFSFEVKWKNWVAAGVVRLLFVLKTGSNRAHLYICGRMKGCRKISEQIKADNLDLKQVIMKGKKVEFKETIHEGR